MSQNGSTDVMDEQNGLPGVKDEAPPIDLFEIANVIARAKKDWVPPRKNDNSFRPDTNDFVGRLCLLVSHAHGVRRSCNILQVPYQRIFNWLRDGRSKKSGWKHDFAKRVDDAGLSGGDYILSKALERVAIGRRTTKFTENDCITSVTEPDSDATIRFYRVWTSRIFQGRTGRMDEIRARVSDVDREPEKTAMEFAYVGRSDESIQMVLGMGSDEYKAWLKTLSSDKKRTISGAINSARELGAMDRAEAAGIADDDGAKGGHGHDFHINIHSISNKLSDDIDTDLSADDDVKH